jgi:small-conductance mechanosensitive channel
LNLLFSALKLAAKMKDRILAFLVSKVGGLITPIIAVAVGSIVARLAMVDPKLAESVDQVSLTGFLVALILSLVNYFTNEMNVKGIKKIQALVSTDVDGVAGPVTYTEVRRAIALKKPATKSRKLK